MPLPWKKAKVGRISRFLANVRSMKHEESLVVETGFPTSIADVVVKNRDRFKKHSKKKHSDISDRSLSLNDQASLNYSNSNYCFPSSQVVVPSVETRNPSQPSSKPLLLDPETTNDTRPSISKRSSPVLVVKKVEDVSVRNKIEDVVESPVRNEKAFVAIVNLFLMLVLALGTNNLVLGVMVSVFALLFFESASEYLFIFFKPSSDAHQRLESLGDISLGPEQEDIGIVFQEEEDDGAESEEFGLIESSLDRIEEIRNVEPGFHLLGGVRKMGVSDSVRMGRIPWKDEDNIEVRDLRNQRTNGAKIKAKKLKKFLTKRFRSSKSKKNDKKEMDSSDLVCNPMGYEKLLGMDEQEQKREDKQEEKEYEEEIEKEEAENVEVRCCEDVSNVKLDSIVVGENSGRKSQGQRCLGYLVLFAIVLFGLVGGRFPAIILTLMWCLLLNLNQLKL